MQWWVISVAVLIGFVVLVNLVRTRKMIRKSEDALFNGNDVRLVTGYGQVRPLSVRSRDWRIKKWFAFGGLAIGIIFIIFSSDLSFPNAMLILWIPLMSVWQMTIPSFFLTKDGLYLDEKRIPWEKFRSYKVEEISIGDDFYGMFPDSTDYYAITLHMKRKKRIAVHKNDAAPLLHQLDQQQIPHEDVSPFSKKASE
ncbi:hypothetical protein [Salipaludibacillus aurantiacus]|uniref:DUF5673 domain-containing protein n=1 Tax=Salipaludibacillus aurantiacus TaxID=1601833 RepID=A0A1H9Q2L4_9BACI|nr:hypothetical protein [Salipaludibacillus aurantiacus]SER54701.1 hypothetical protein SAMN05518684_10218 [Salipaludibacillus aurantiacus]